MSQNVLTAEKPLTSIIMVTYHTGPDLFPAIDSALAQSVPVELILVDNGNPPEVLARIRDIAAKEPRLTLITGQGNIGFGRANNLGVRHSKGKFLLILNPDSVLSPETIAGLWAHTDKLMHPFMIGARIVDKSGQDQRGCRRNLLTPQSAFIEAFHLQKYFPEHRLNRHDDAIPDTLGNVPAISGACMFLSRGDFDLINGFDEGYFLHVEDLDFCYRFRQASGEIFFAPDVKITHVGGTSDAPSRFIERCKARGFTRYFHRNFMGSYPLPFLWCLDAAIWTRYAIKCGLSLLSSRKRAGA